MSIAEQSQLEDFEPDNHRGCGITVYSSDGLVSFPIYRFNDGRYSFRSPITKKSIPKTNLPELIAVAKKHCLEQWKRKAFDPSEGCRILHTISSAKARGTKKPRPAPAEVRGELAEFNPWKESRSHSKSYHWIEVRPELNPAAKLAYCYMANEARETGVYAGGKPAIARHLRISERTVDAVIAKLEEVQVIRSYPPAKNGMNGRYTFLLRPDWVLLKDGPPAKIAGGETVTPANSAPPAPAVAAGGAGNYCGAPPADSAPLLRREEPLQEKEEEAQLAGPADVFALSEKEKKKLARRLAEMPDEAMLDEAQRLRTDLDVRGQELSKFYRKSEEDGKASSMPRFASWIVFAHPGAPKPKQAASTGTKEPPGWQEWVARKYPHGSKKNRWTELPDDIQREFIEEHPELEFKGHSFQRLSKLQQRELEKTGFVPARIPVRSIF